VRSSKYPCTDSSSQFKHPPTAALLTHTWLYVHSKPLTLSLPCALPAHCPPACLLEPTLQPCTWTCSSNNRSSRHFCGGKYVCKYCSNQLGSLAEPGGAQELPCLGAGVTRGCCIARADPPFLLHQVVVGPGSCCCCCCCMRHHTCNNLFATRTCRGSNLQPLLLHRHHCCRFMIPLNTLQQRCTGTSLGQQFLKLNLCCCTCRSSCCLPIELRAYTSHYMIHGDGP